MARLFLKGVLEPIDISIQEYNQIQKLLQNESNDRIFLESGQIFSANQIKFLTSDSSIENKLYKITFDNVSDFSKELESWNEKNGNKEIGENVFLHFLADLKLIKIIDSDKNLSISGIGGYTIYRETVNTFTRYCSLFDEYKNQKYRRKSQPKEIESKEINIEF